MREKLQHSRCDDGTVMIHSEGDVFAFIDSNQAAPFDEELAARICLTFNAHDELLAGLRDLVDTIQSGLDAGLILSTDGKRPDLQSLNAAVALLEKHGGGQ
ncbi:hypothetical protein HJB67_12840 [Rhizobium lentis]|uniref:hypothetical protein n=1 Tax=Rhizobium lentis TaxID=1138194 RepID=UPI001C83D5EB|nr:hypothetical protein [Rhizobium lentis]MBX5010841.1 hypothetical protein [Rhizobium lentis]